jgi:maltooligosyltrehalose trehalohydrolase
MLGAHYQPSSEANSSAYCTFMLWAPLCQQVAVHLVEPTEAFIPLQRDEQGYWSGTLPEICPGTLYYYHLDGERDCPDPASFSQPQGVHGPSQVIDPQHAWTDQDWTGVTLEQMTLYELHVGTFTSEGTFEAIIPRLPELKSLGINTIEIMPVAAFPGDRNWGYDGVFPYAVQTSYGGVEGLKQLVNACHVEGMAVVLDVVYNHLGPEGNYLWELGTYFIDKYKTPWGSAVNYDDVYSNGVRHYFIENVRYWLETCQLDALRLDAVHAIYDFGAKHILKEMATITKQLAQQQGRQLYLIAESDLNDPQIIRPQAQGGYGIDAQWSDDFHHALHAVLTGEQQGYYSDFGSLEHLAKAYRNAFVYAWDYSPFRKRYHGEEPKGCLGRQFVVCSQNHDQVGNRMGGDRLSTLIPFAAQKLAAAAVILSPFVPLLFMGEEYGEPNPFLYFVSHSDQALIKAIREGRKVEFAEFHAQGEAPDPQTPETFARSTLQWDLRQQGKHQQLWQFYQRLFELRRQTPALAHLERDHIEVTIIGDSILKLHRGYQKSQVLCWLNFSSESIQVTDSFSPGSWSKLLDSSESIWGGSGSSHPLQYPNGTIEAPITLPPYSAVVYGQNP